MKTPPWKLTTEQLAQQQQAEAPADTPIEHPNGIAKDAMTGRFVKGGAGRPKGSRNKVTLAIENMMEGEAERLSRKCIDLALSGDTTAMRLVLDRIAPVRKGRPLPKLNRHEAETSIEALLRNVLDGEISPDEAKDVVGLIESAARVAAAKALTEMREQQIEALKKVREAGGVPGGLMLVPLVSGADEWETFAVSGQHNLKQTVRD